MSRASMSLLYMYVYTCVPLSPTSEVEEWLCHTALQLVRKGGTMPVCLLHCPLTGGSSLAQWAKKGTPDATHYMAT